jgi:plasmid maintenance system killer protein
VHVEFVNELQMLYEAGAAPGCRIPRHIVDKFIRTIGSLEAAYTVEDIRANRGYNFEQVDDFYSMRLNKQWRLELTIVWADDQHPRETVYPRCLSKHYKERWP